MSTSVYPLPACPAALPACFLSLWPPPGVLTSLPTAVLGFTPHGLCWPRRSPRPPPGLPVSLWSATASCPHPVESPSKSLPESQTHSWPTFPDSSQHPGPLCLGFPSCGQPRPPSRAQDRFLSPNISCLLLGPRALRCPGHTCTALHGPARPGNCLPGSPHGASGRLSTLCPAGQAGSHPSPLLLSIPFKNIFAHKQTGGVHDKPSPGQNLAFLEGTVNTCWRPMPTYSPNDQQEGQLQWAFSQGWPAGARGFCGTSSGLLGPDPTSQGAPIAVGAGFFPRWQA